MNKSLSASSSSTVSNGQQSLPISVPHPSSLPVQHPTMKPKRTRRTVNPKRPNAGRSSKYRGVTKHRWTGRFEAHLWDKNSCNNQKKKGKQVYLGAYDDEVAAAHTYDLAALKFWGRDTILNFAVENYERQYEAMQKVTREEFLSSLRRLSSGFARGQSRYRGVARHHHNGRWEARIGRVYGNKYLYLGTYKTQEEAAMAYDRAAIMYRGANAITNFDIASYLHLPELQQLDLPPPPQQPNDSHPPPAPQTPPQAAEPFRPPSPSSTFQNLSILNGGSQEVIDSSDFISTSEFLEPEVQSAEFVDPAISSDFISTSELFEPVQSAEFVDPAMGYDDSWNLCLDPAFDPLPIPDGISEIPSTFMDLLNDNAFDVDVDYDFTEEAVGGNDWVQFLNESDGLDEAMVDQGGALVEPVDTMSPATSAAASAVPGPGPFGCAYPMNMYS